MVGAMLTRSLALALSLTALACTGAHARNAGVTPTPFAGDAISAARLAMAYGTVTSIHRTPERNRLVGGVANSYHLSGRAIDIARKPGVTHVQIATVLRQAGYNLIESLDEGDHSHFAFGTAVAPDTKAARSIPIVTAEVPADTKPKFERPVLADDHGTLLIDMKAGPAPITAR